MWGAGDAYEAYVGRWSRRVAETFLGWLDRPAGGRWLDVGCGTGAVTAAILKLADPAEVVGVDPSEGFLAQARQRITDPRARFRTADAVHPDPPGPGFDTVVSGLALNFFPDPPGAVARSTRACVPGGTVAAYVWDYAEGMAMMRHFWDAAAEVDPGAADLDEGSRFPLCAPAALRALWTDSGLCSVAVRGIETPTVFADFDDYWRPFLGGQGAAPTYLATLSPGHRDAIRDVLRQRLPTAPDGSIRLTARAWAVRGGTAQRP